MEWTGLDELIETLEEYREKNRFATISVQIRDHTYAHVKKEVVESKVIKPKSQKAKNGDLQPQ